MIDIEAQGLFIRFDILFSAITQLDGYSYDYYYYYEIHKQGPVELHPSLVQQFSMHQNRTSSTIIYYMHISQYFIHNHFHLIDRYVYNSVLCMLKASLLFVPNYIYEHNLIYMSLFMCNKMLEQIKCKEETEQLSK